MGTAMISTFWRNMNFTNALRLHGGRAGHRRPEPQFHGDPTHRAVRRVHGHVGGEWPAKNGGIAMTSSSPQTEAIPSNRGPVGTSRSA